MDRTAHVLPRRHKQQYIESTVFNTAHHHHNTKVCWSTTRSLSFSFKSMLHHKTYYDKLLKSNRILKLVLFALEVNK